MRYAFLWGSLFLLMLWLAFFLWRKPLRKEIFWVSFWTGFLGLTEPFFVSEYWNPPTLFDLAKKIGFDIESLVFAFAIGGIASVAYEAIFRKKHQKMPHQERHQLRHRFHFLAVVSAPIAFVALYSLTSMNPIYSAVIAMVIGFFTALLCRPDLQKKMLASGFIFFALYFVFFFFFNILFSGYVRAVWNFKTISGILIAGIPLEELLFAFALGLYWSSIYEHVLWYKIKRSK